MVAMTVLKLAHEIIQELDRQRKESDDPVTVNKIASAAGLLSYAAMPYQEGFPSGQTFQEIRKMAVGLAALTMRYVLEGDWTE